MNLYLGFYSLAKAFHVFGMAQRNEIIQGTDVEVGVGRDSELNPASAVY